MHFKGEKNYRGFTALFSISTSLLDFFASLRFFKLFPLALSLTHSCRLNSAQRNSLPDETFLRFFSSKKCCCWTPVRKSHVCRKWLIITKKTPCLTFCNTRPAGGKEHNCYHTELSNQTENWITVLKEKSFTSANWTFFAILSSRISSFFPSRLIAFKFRFFFFSSVNPFFFSHNSLILLRLKTLFLLDKFEQHLRTSYRMRAILTTASKRLNNKLRRARNNLVKKTFFSYTIIENGARLGSGLVCEGVHAALSTAFKVKSRCYSCTTAVDTPMLDNIFPPLLFRFSPRALVLV